MLRRRAREQRFGVDAFVSASLEYLLLGDTVGTDSLTSLVTFASRELAQPAISPAPELHEWQRLLEGSGEPPADELPSICVPMRLLSQLAVPLRAQKLQAALIGDHEAGAAMLLETVATRHGLTMGFWALRQLAPSGA